MDYAILNAHILLGAYFYGLEVCFMDYNFRCTLDYHDVVFIALSRESLHGLAC